MAWLIDWKKLLTRVFLRRPQAAAGASREEMLRDNHERYRELFEHGQGLICVHDLEGRLLDVNPEAGRSLGYVSSEAIGRNLADFLFPKDRPGFAAYLAGMKEGDRSNGLMRVRTRDGEKRVWMYRNVRIDKPGRSPYVLGYAIDVTELRRLEIEKQEYLDRIEKQNLDLELRNREIEKANRLKSAFVAAMSHELRTPLTSIIGFSDLLAEEPERLDEQQRLYLGFIRQASRHLLQLINDVLDLSKIEAGKVELSLGDVEARDAALEALAVVDPLLAQREIRVESEVPAGLTVRADRVRLRQILLNLLSNAVKFTPDGGTVRLSASLLEDFACFTVSDTGIGIPPEEQTTIFTEFHQVGMTVRGIREGTGLGLAIVRRLVEQHGGKIWVDSEPGKGSCFTFLLPAGHREAPSLPEKPAVVLPRPRRAQPLVLVADDDPAVRELLSGYVRAEGYDAETSASGAAAVEAVRRLRPDLLTLEALAGAGDGGDGWQALRELKADPETAAIPVVMVTVVDEKRKGFALGATEYLVKPAERAALLQVVRRLVPLPSRSPEAVLTIENTAEGQRELVDAVLAAGYRPLAARDGKEAMRVLAQIRPGAVVVSLLLPEQDAFQTILRLRADPVFSDLPVLALAPEDLSLYHIRLLSSGPTRVVFQEDRSWKDRLVPELQQLLGEPAPVVS
jgi:PAS domain S-box-containing protein